VNFAGADARVVFDQDQVEVEDLREAVRRIGYDVAEIVPEASEERTPVAARYAEEARTQRRNVIGAALLTIPVAILAMTGVAISHLNNTEREPCRCLAVAGLRDSRTWLWNALRWSLVTSSTFTTIDCFRKSSNWFPARLYVSMVLGDFLSARRLWRQLVSAWSSSMPPVWHRRKVRKLFSIRPL
jgi:cation transport ATPase